MLDELRVTNLGLIPDAQIEPGPGLVVISGETGTGKTLLLGALRLLRGEQARKDQIGPGGDTTVVEARFVDDDEEHILTRSVNRTRSKAGIDGSMATAATLAAALDGVLDVVGQHDRTLLRETTAVRSLLDGTLNSEGTEALARYRAVWANLVGVESEAEALGGDRRALERELDMVRFQHREIADAGFERGDEADLVVRASRLRNTEELRERLGAAERAAGDQGGAEVLSAVARELHAAARVDASLGPLVEMGDQVVELLSELNAEIVRVASELDHEPRELEHVESRLALLFDLKRKYGDDLEAVLEFEAKAEARANELEALLERSEAIDRLLAAARRDVEAAADDVTGHRERAGERLAEATIEHLRDLGFGDPVVAFTIVPRDPGPQGADRITLEFASDRALPLAPVSNVASGGELSRLILALRLAAGAAGVSIIAFDEIDAGIGGSTALAMGKKLKALSLDRQVFCVTHLPQVAAFADRHFVVEREGNVASVTRIDGDRQLEELSRMLAGLTDSAQGRGHAAELLDVAARS